MSFSAAARFPATSFVAVFGVVCATVFMDMTGGGLKPYEMQTAQTAFAYVVGEASAEEAFDGPAPHYPTWRAPVPAPAPMIYTSTDENSGGQLMGGLGAQVGRFQPTPIDAARTAPTCPSGAQHWVASSTQPAEAAT